MLVFVVCRLRLSCHGCSLCCRSLSENELLWSLTTAPIGLKATEADDALRHHFVDPKALKAAGAVGGAAGTVGGAEDSLGDPHPAAINEELVLRLKRMPQLQSVKSICLLILVCAYIMLLTKPPHPLASMPKCIGVRGTTGA
eukprot:s1638_g11.t1